MEIEQHLQETKKLLESNEFVKASDKFDSIVTELGLTSFSSPRTSLFFSHLRILLRFTSKDKIEINNFSDQLTVIKNHFLNINPNANQSDLIHISYNIALLNFIMGHHFDSEKILKSLINFFENEVSSSRLNFLFSQSLYLLLEIYLQAKDTKKFWKIFEKLKLITDRTHTDQKEVTEIPDFEFQLNSNENEHLFTELNNMDKRKLVPLFWYFYYKFEGHLMDSNINSAATCLNMVIKSFQLVSPDSFNKNTSLFLKSKMGLYHREKKEYSYALKTLTCIDVNSAPKELKLLANFNEASLYFMGGHENSSNYKFDRLLPELCNSSVPNFEVNSICMIDYGRIACFNYGISLLKKEPIQAFKLFCEATNFYYSNPFLWSKMGQACVQAFKHELKRSGESNEDPKVLNYKICSECFKMYDAKCLPEKKRPPCKNCGVILEKLSKNPDDLMNNSYGFSLLDSITYFQRASILLSKTNAPSQDYLKEVVAINMITASFYIKDYYGAISQIKAFLRMENIEARNRFIAMILYGRSLAHLRKPNESLKIMSSVRSDSEKDTKFKAVYYNNLSCLYIQKGDDIKAGMCLLKTLEAVPLFLPALRNKELLKNRMRREGD